MKITFLNGALLLSVLSLLNFSCSRKAVPDYKKSALPKRTFITNQLLTQEQTAYLEKNELDRLYYFCMKEKAVIDAGHEDTLTTAVFAKTDCRVVPLGAYRLSSSLHGEAFKGNAISYVVPDSGYRMYVSYKGKEIKGLIKIEHKDGVSKPFYFSDFNNQPPQSETYRKALNLALERSEVFTIRFSATRYVFAYSDKGKIGIVSFLAGHFQHFEDINDWVSENKIYKYKLDF